MLKLRRVVLLISSLAIAVAGIFLISSASYTGHYRIQFKLAQAQLQQVVKQIRTGTEDKKNKEMIDQIESAETLLEKLMGQIQLQGSFSTWLGYFLILIAIVNLTIWASLPLKEPDETSAADAAERD